MSIPSVSFPRRWLQRALWSVCGLLTLALPSQADPDRITSCPPQARPAVVHVQLERRGERVRAHLGTALIRIPGDSSPIQPLLRLPPDVRSPLRVRREVVQAMQVGGTPDPAHPLPYRILLIVTPEGQVHYVADSSLSGIRYLAFNAELTWGTSLPANDQVVLELLDDDRWLGRPWLDCKPRSAVQRAAGRVRELQLDCAGLTAVPPALGELTRLQPACRCWI